MGFLPGECFIWLVFTKFCILERPMTDVKCESDTWAGNYRTPELKFLITSLFSMVVGSEDGCKIGRMRV